MEWITTDKTNTTYRGGGNVGDLPCERAVVNIGTEEEPEHALAVFSVWEPTDLERERIAAGANCKLGILTEPIPPVMLDVVDEPRAKAPGPRSTTDTDHQGGRA